MTVDGELKFNQATPLTDESKSKTLKTGLTQRHEDTKKFKIQDSKFKLFFVRFVASCESWILILT